MSHQQVFKKLRKEMRRDIDEKYKALADHLREQGFWQRLPICMKLLFKP